MATMTSEERAAKSNETRARAFDAWMQKAETKLMLSMVPQSNPPEAVQTLLRACFDAGSQSGTGEILGEFIEAMFKSKADDKRGYL